MAYSNELRVFWYNPPRTGTRSTKKIQNFLNFEHPGSHDEISNNFLNYYYVSNIRNPYSRLVSIFYFFHYLNKKNDSNVEKFKRFVKKKNEEELKNIGRFTSFFSLSLNSVFKKTDRYPDYFVKIEDFEQSIRELWFIKEKSLETTLENLIIEEIRKNSYHHEYGYRLSWKKHYDEETAEIVYYHLKNDFELGNYDKNSWKNGTS